LHKTRRSEPFVCTVVWRLELFGSVAGSSMGVAHASCNSLVELRKKSVKEVNECRFSF